MNWWVVFLVFVIIVTLDKGLTYANVAAVQRNNPTLDATSVEKNPIARWSFKQFGLFGGTIFYWFISLATLYIALFLFYYPAQLVAPDNAMATSLYAIMILYGLIIANNSYFLLRYNNLL